MAQTRKCGSVQRFGQGRENGADMPLPAEFTLSAQRSRCSQRVAQRGLRQQAAQCRGHRGLVMAIHQQADTPSSTSSRVPPSRPAITAVRAYMRPRWRSEAFEITAAFQIDLRMQEHVCVTVQLHRTALLDETRELHHIASAWRATRARNASSSSPRPAST